jgi:hypothetical protein
MKCRTCGYNYNDRKVANCTRYYGCPGSRSRNRSSDDTVTESFSSVSSSSWDSSSSSSYDSGSSGSCDSGSSGGGGGGCD